jgi:hypothetical protein
MWNLEKIMKVEGGLLGESKKIRGRVSEHNRMMNMIKICHMHTHYFVELIYAKIYVLI